jgi:diguanylate cyclase (GGDEF)-like protein
MPDKRFDELPLVRSIRAHLDELTNRAFRSSLTNLLNKSAYDALGEVFPDEEAVGVAFMDLTGFKAINEKFTYAGGNATLAKTGTLWESIAETVVGRAFHFSGDEFVMVFPSVRLRDFQVTFEAVLATFKLRYEGREIEANANVGVAEPEAGQALEGLLKRAEAACKEGKSSGRVGVTVWNSTIVKRSLIEARWQCKSCGAVTAVTVETSLSASVHRCANCSTERMPAIVA